MIRTLRTGGRIVEYTLVCMRGRTSFLLQALPQGKIKLYAPAFCSLREADRIVKENLKKVESACAAMDAAAQTLTDTLLFKGKRYPLNISQAKARRITLTEEGLRVLTPYSDSENINAQIKRWLVKSALEDIRLNLDKWSLTVAVPYGRVTVREQRTRWGSCSSKHNLNFNWKLILAPPEALEYVVIHELCHLIHLNHSERFWAEVKKRMPEYESWKRWLKLHGSELHFP